MATEQPFAVCLIYDPVRERCFHESFTAERHLDPLTAAHAFAGDLRARDDFPGALITVTGNGAAGEIRSASLMALVGFVSSEGGRMPERALTRTQSEALHAVARWDTCGGLTARDGNQERTLRSLRRRGLVVRVEGRWYRPFHAPAPSEGGRA